MAKKSMIERELKKFRCVERFSKRRLELKKILKNSTSTEEEVWAAQQQIQKMPRDSSPSRLQSRCKITGRPHAVYKKFGLSRIKLREMVMRGEVPGMRKASW